MLRLLRFLLLVASLVTATRALAQFPILDGTRPGPNYTFYGLTWYQPRIYLIPEITIPIPGTRPTSKWSTDYYYIPAASKAPWQSLTENASYHNAVEYGKSVAWSNVLRSTVLVQEKATNKKLLGPLTGKAPSSLSFWEWLEVGDQSLKLYGRYRNMVLALKSGDITIDLWKLAPKIGVINENDSSDPLLTLSVMPASDGALLNIKQLTDFSDPRYRLENKVQLSNLKGLVPSLAVKPSFYGALAHYMKDDQTGRVVMYRLQRNMHELMTSLSMLKRQVAGYGDNDTRGRRWTVATQRDEVRQLTQESIDFWNDAVSEIGRGMREIIGPSESASWVSANRAAFNAIAKLEQRTMEDGVERRGADVWAAQALAADMNNITLPLENEDYLKWIKDVEDMMATSASSSADVVMGEEQLTELRLEATDAAVNKMIRDELRAIRQIYSLKAKREFADKLAPSIAKGLLNVREASERLDGLRKRLQLLQGAQQAESQVLSPGQIGKLLHESFFPMR